MNHSSKTRSSTSSQSTPSSNSNLNSSTEDQMTVDYPNGGVVEEHKRKEVMGNMEQIEREFATIKENFFADKIDALEKENEAIENGTHQGFIRKMEELEEQKVNKIWGAQKVRDYMLNNIQSVYDSERQQAENEHASEVEALKAKTLKSIMKKLKKLEEENKNSMSTNVVASSTNSSTSNLQTNNTSSTPLTPTDKNTRTSRKKRASSGKDSNSRRKLNVPHIQCALKDSEILDDLKQIQRATSNHPSYSKQLPLPLIK